MTATVPTLRPERVVGSPITTEKQSSRIATNQNTSPFASAHAFPKVEMGINLAKYVQIGSLNIVKT